MKSSVPESQGGSGGEEEDPFKMNGLNLTGTHLEQFLKEGSAQTELLGNGDLKFSGPDSAFIYKKGMEVTLGNEQLITLKAKGDLKGGAIGVYLFGDYSIDLRTTATSITNLQWKTMQGFRVEIWGSGTHSLDIKEIEAVPVS